MENAKLEIVKFDNADVIATSTTPGPITQFFKIFGVGDETAGNIKFEYYENDTYVDRLENIPGAKELTDFVNGKLGTNFGIYDELVWPEGDAYWMSADDLMTLDDTWFDELNGTYEWVKNTNRIVKQ